MLEENIRTFMTAILEARPKGLPGQGLEGKCIYDYYLLSTGLTNL